MARYKPYSYAQGKFLPIHFAKQILPGTFEYSLNHLIDHELDLSRFDERFKNDVTGATAYDLRTLLKIALYAYSRGIVSSRKIERACQKNIIFIALSADTLASFYHHCRIHFLHGQKDHPSFPGCTAGLR